MDVSTLKIPSKRRESTAQWQLYRRKRDSELHRGDNLKKTCIKLTRVHKDCLHLKVKKVLVLAQFSCTSTVFLY